MQRQRALFWLGWIAVAVLAMPSLLIGAATVGGTPAVCLTLLLSAWALLAAVTSGATADHHTAVVYVIAIALHAGLYAMVSVPTHFLTRTRPRLHALAVPLIALLFLVLTFVAFPIRHLDL